MSSSLPPSFPPQTVTPSHFLVFSSRWRHQLQLPLLLVNDLHLPLPTLKPLEVVPIPPPPPQARRQPLEPFSVLHLDLPGSFKKQSTSSKNLSSSTKSLRTLTAKVWRQRGSRERWSSGRRRRRREEATRRRCMSPSSKVSSFFWCICHSTKELTKCSLLLRSRRYAQDRPRARILSLHQG